MFVLINLLLHILGWLQAHRWLLHTTCCHVEQILVFRKLFITKLGHLIFFWFFFLLEIASFNYIFLSAKSINFSSSWCTFSGVTINAHPFLFWFFLMHVKQAVLVKMLYWYLTKEFVKILFSSITVQVSDNQLFLFFFG